MRAWMLGGVAIVTIALCVLAPLRQLSGDTVPGRLGGAVLRCSHSFDLTHIDWVHDLQAEHGTFYYMRPDYIDEYTSVFGPAPAVVGAAALLDVGEGSTISDDTLRRRERGAAAVLLAFAAVLLALACAAKTTPMRALIATATAVLSFAGAASLGQGLWQATTALPPLMAGLALVAWHDRRPRLVLGAPAALLVAMMLRPPVAPLAVGIGALWLWRERAAWRRLAIATGIALVAVTPLVVWNAIHYWSPLPLGQWHANAQSTSHVFVAPTGIAGLLVSPARGILWFAPVAVVGVVARARTPVAIAAILQVIAMAAFFKWHGGQAYGPRLLTEATWVAIWLACDVRWAALVPAAAVTVLVGQLGLWLYQPEQWEVRRRPESHPDAFWDVRDNPITSTLDDIPSGMAHGYDSPQRVSMHCDHGRLSTR